MQEVEQCFGLVIIIAFVCVCDREETIEMQKGESEGLKKERERRQNVHSGSTKAAGGRCSQSGPPMQPQQSNSLGKCAVAATMKALSRKRMTAECTGRGISGSPCYSRAFRDVLHKETRAVKLVFLQTVKEVTTDGADAARRATDTQY